MRRQYGVTAAIDKPEHIIVRDLLAEPNAARAENATLIVERDARPKLDILRFLDLVLKKARFGVSVLDAKLLQSTFTGLIADRTIERMIDQQEFHYTSLTFFHQGRIGAHAHAVGAILGAGN